MTRPIKITYIIDALKTNLAGTENQLIKMINGLDKEMFTVELICFNHHPWLEENAASLDCRTTVIEFNRFKRPGPYVRFFKIVGLLRRTNPDIVHTFFPIANIFGVLAARAAGVKCVISSRRDFGEWMNRRYLTATRFADRFVDTIVTNSDKVKELTEEKEKVDPSKIEVILNGINTRAFENIRRDHSLKKRINIPGGDRVVGIVANFRPMKHHQTFLKAAAEVIKARDDVSFLLIGGGPLRGEMEDVARKLDIGGKTHFVDSQKDVISYLSIMDIGVNCSQGEGLSNAIMEYMAAGLPCIVSQAGGNTDLIADNYNGYTFKLDDYSALASLILNLLDDRATRERFAQNARETVKKNMSLEVILSKYENFYRDMTKRGLRAMPCEKRDYSL